MDKEKLLGMNLQYFAEEGTKETDPVDNQEKTKETEANEDEVLSKEEANRLIAQQKSKAKQEAKKEYENELNDLKKEVEDLRLQNMPEEDQKSYKQTKAEKEEQERIKQLEQREQALELKEKAMQAHQQLSEAEIDTQFVDILVDTGTFETTEDKIEAFKDMYSEVLSEQVSKGVKEALSGKSPKANSGGNKVITKAEIMDIKDPVERQQKIAENPHLFKY